MVRLILCTRIAASAALVLAPCTARAVIFVSTGNPSYNTSAPGGSLGNSGWQYEFIWSSFLATPVDPYHLLAAAHVGGQVGAQFTFQGATYTTVPFADSSSYHDFGDLRLFQVDKPFNSYAPLYDTTTDGSEVGKTVVVLGRGRQRGAPVVVNSVTKGWTWGTLDNVERWGQNKVTAIADYSMTGDQELFGFNFDAGGSGYTGVNEATLAEGDSSGGVFINVNGQWKLAGVNYGVTGPYGLTANDTPFLVALTDTGGLYNRSDPNNPVFIPDLPTDQPSAWFASRVSKSLAGIEAFLSLPPTWNVDSSGLWSASGNWVHGAPPGGIGAEADFRFAITAARTVTLDSNRTVGILDFDSPSAYTLAGTSTLTLDVAGGNASVNVAAGMHIIQTPVTLNDATTFNIIPSSAKLTLSGTLSASGRDLTKIGLGTLAARHIRANSLTITAGRVTVPADGTSSGTSKVSSLAIATGGLLDLTNNHLIVGGSNTGAWNGSAYSGITGMIASARNGGAWDGTTGITTSSIPSGDTLHGIGVASASAIFHLTGTQTASWSGQTVSASDTLVMYTYAGDANLDGKINIDDYGRIDGNVGLSGTVFGWYNGDFNYDGKINIDDYGIIDGNIGIQGAPIPIAAQTIDGVTAVPEPSIITGLMFLSVGGLARRQRRKSLICTPMNK